MALAAALSGEGFLGFILILYYNRLVFVKFNPPIMIPRMLERIIFQRYTLHRVLA